VSGFHDNTCPSRTLCKEWIKRVPKPMVKRILEFDVRGSVHHSIIHKENPTRCNSVSEFYFIFIWSSTCFGWHNVHHQDPKTALAASGFAYVEGCTKLQPSGLTKHAGKISYNYTSNNPPRMQNQRVLVQF